MSVLNFVKKELSGWGKLERFFFPLGIIFIILVSLLMQDSKIALISAICGITYTIFAGKGRILCYVFGITATLCYSYLAFIAGLYGNFALNLFYYFPMEIAGIFNWKKHLKKNSAEIVKTQLEPKSRLVFLATGAIFTAILTVIFAKTGGEEAFFDAFTTVFSILGMILTVKRCIEQWFVWMAVNALSAYMWFELYLQGENCFVMVLKWIVYFCLAIYFWNAWRKELEH